MKTKIKVALIYKKDYGAFQPGFYGSSFNNFFMKALKRNQDIEISYFGVDSDYFDTTKLRGNCDIILLAENSPYAAPETLEGIHSQEIPVVCRTDDPHFARRYNQIRYHRKWKIDYYFGHLPSSYFHKFYPPDFKYKEIPFGLESSLYNNLKPYKERIKDKILNSGYVGRLNFIWTVIDALSTTKRSPWHYYKLRILCNKLPYVDYAGMKGAKYIKKDYPTYLSEYRSAIAATTCYPTAKYLEIPAAGCLTFMEITEKNDAYFLGFKDRETVIFINEKNYKDRFTEFLSDPDNPKWEEIANAGREYVMNNLNNDIAVKKLVEVMKELL